VIAEINITYGPWRGLKTIFKEAEARDDWEIYSALAARFDTVLASGAHRIKKPTILYLVRRAWRSLRRVGQSFPALYADKAAEILAHYRDDTQWGNTWLANHILYHETGSYGRQNFTFSRPPSQLTKHRAFNELWRRSHRPLFALLETARSEQVRRFATSSLKSDFRASLREIEVAWVQRLVAVHSDIIDEFVVWVFENVPKFEQDNFNKLGLHATVLQLLESSALKAREYAVKYARIHARDLSFDALLTYVRSDCDKVSGFAIDIIQSRHPKKEIGLDGWGALLDIRQSHKTADDNLRKHFTSRDLNLAWFEQRLLQPGCLSFDFAQNHLGKLHSIKKIGADFFCQLLSKADYKNAQVRRLIRWCLAQLNEFDLNALDGEFLKTLLINPASGEQVINWVDRGQLNLKVFDVEFLKVLAFRPTWEQDPWVEPSTMSSRWM